MLADFLGSISYSSAIFLANGPDIAIVLLAVHKSTILTKAAIIVSDIIDKLSPNIAPHTTAPKTSATYILILPATATPIGPIAAIVTTDVPIDIDIKHPITNNPVTNKLSRYLFIK